MMIVLESPSTHIYHAYNPKTANRTLTILQLIRQKVLKEMIIASLPLRPTIVDGFLST